MHFHDVSKNPSRFHNSLSEEEIAAYSSRPRHPVKTGTRLVLERGPRLPSETAREGRRSCRSFADKPVAGDAILTILSAAYDIRRRAVASAGALYPLRIFVLVERVQDGLPTGYYEFDAETASLIRFDDSDEEQVRYCFNSETLPYGSTAQIVIAADLRRHAGKYANRGYRFTLIEAGLAAQNAVQAAAELGLSTCLLGSFVDDALSEELSLEEGTEPLLALAVGIASDVEQPTETVDIVAESLIGEGKPVLQVAVSELNFGDASFFGAYAEYDGNKVSTISGGTATSLKMAKTKATLEGVERYASGIPRVDLKAPLADLGDRSVLTPSSVMPLSADQLDRYGLMALGPTQSIEWVKGSRVADGEEVLVAADLVFYPLDGLSRPLSTKTNSSGVALHTDAEEATRRGLLELIERDAIVRTWMSQQPPVRVSPLSIPAHEARRVRFWAERGREVHVLDIAPDDVSVYLVVITGTEPPYLSAGAAADEDSAEIAIRKAFREAEFALLSHSRDPVIRDMSYEEVRYVSDHAALHSDPKYAKAVAWLHNGPLRKLDNPVARRSPINELHQRYRSVAVRLQSPDPRLSVIRVLSTELVPIAFGFDSLPWSHPKLSHVSPRSRTIPHFFS